MDAVRRCINIHEDGKVENVIKLDAFWNGPVIESANEMQRLKSVQRQPDTYIANESALDGLAKMLNAAMFDVPGLIVSSTGDIDRLGYLSRWSPSRLSATSSAPSLVVTQLTISMRATFMPTICTFWEWDKKITLNLHAARKYHDEEDLQIFKEATKRWINAIINS